MESFGSLTPLEGGWSGETFVAEAGGERTVVRIFVDPRHRAEAPEIIAALHELVRGLLPVPEILEMRRRRTDDSPAMLVTEFLGGVRGDQVLPSLDDEGLRRAGAAIGSVAGVLAGMPTVRAGLWADGDLRIDAFDLELPGWVDRHRAALVRADWTASDLRGLDDVAERAQDRLAAVRRTCVVHSDLNPKNLLLDPDSLTVTGVVDWEFSHSGSPFTDLGNVVRWDRRPAYVDGVLDAWRDRHGGDAAEILDLARSADLVALVELASRSGQNPVATRAHEHLLGIARTGDVHACG